MSLSLRELYESSPFSSAQAPYLEALYDRFLDDPASLDPQWRAFFEQLGPGMRAPARIVAAPLAAHRGHRGAAGEPIDAPLIGQAAATEKQAATISTARWTRTSTTGFTTR